IVTGELGVSPEHVKRDGDPEPVVMATRECQGFRTDPSRMHILPPGLGCLSDAHQGSHSLPRVTVPLRQLVRPATQRRRLLEVPRAPGQQPGADERPDGRWPVVVRADPERLVQPLSALAPVAANVPKMVQGTDEAQRRLPTLLRCETPGKRGA